MRKTEFVTVNLEPDLIKIIDLFRVKESISASAYFRKLAIKDLQERGLLPAALLIKLL